MTHDTPPTPTPTPSAPAPRHWLFWLVLAVAGLGAVYVLRGVLLPFVAGAAVAYFLDPAVDWLERKGLGRTLATVVITALFLAAAVGGLLLLIPALQHEIALFLENLPAYATALENRLRPLLDSALALLPAEQVESLRQGAAGMIGDAAALGLRLLRRVLTSGLALISVVSLLVITPVVTFYLLRDWDRLVGTVDGWLPRAHLETLRKMAADIDRTLSGFVRGQALVCLVLGIFYAVGLSAMGLELGLLVGLGSGLFSFIPYVGAIGGFVVSMALAFAQFSDPWPIAGVAAVYMVGQALEGNVLSPWLVGGRVGLHPVWLIFALLAAGSLFGFVGLLLAVPVAAVIGVVVRHFLGRYLASPVYLGKNDDTPPTRTPDP